MPRDRRGNWYEEANRGEVAKEVVSQPKKAIAGCLTIALVLVVALAVLVGLDHGRREYNRYQARQEAKNQVIVHSRLIVVEEQRAEIRRKEAQGIRDSQQIINETLTPIYIQYLALQTQAEWAASSNKGVIYLPADNGIPLVRDTATDE